MAMAFGSGFARSTWIISRFELMRTFRTRRSLVALVAFAIVWYLILRYPMLSAANFITSNSDNEMAMSLMLEFGGGGLLQWSIAEFAVYWQFTQFLFPVLCLILTADQTASDRERGSLRYLSPRCGRDSIFFGRFLGQFLIMAILIAFTLLTTLSLVLLRDTGWSDPQLWAEAVAICFNIATNMLVLLLPFIALMAMLSASVSSARLAILWAIILLIVLPRIIGAFAAYVPFVGVLNLLVPGAKLADVIGASGGEPPSILLQRFLQLSQCLVLLALGRTVMARSAL